MLNHIITYLVGGFMILEFVCTMDEYGFQWFHITTNAYSSQV
jgi:hypothetical protein